MSKHIGIYKNKEVEMKLDERDIIYNDDLEKLFTDSFYLYQLQLLFEKKLITEYIYKKLINQLNLIYTF